MGTPFRVLVAEDDSMVKLIYRRFLFSIPGFELIGEVSTGLEMLSFLKQDSEIDLLLLDIFMPEMDGIKALKKLRTHDSNVDIVLISSRNKSNLLKESISLGAFDYLVKPITFERFAITIEAYRKYRECINSAEILTQEDIDSIFSFRGKAKNMYDLPKGLQRSTLKTILEILDQSKDPLSSSEVAKMTGFSRATVRRYLEFLVQDNKAILQPEYHRAGRPTNRYYLLS